MLYGLPTNSLKFILLAFWKKETPFVDQKCTYEKVPKNLDRALPPPSFGHNPKEHGLFFGTSSLIVDTPVYSCPASCVTWSASSLSVD